MIGGLGCGFTEASGVTLYRYKGILLGNVETVIAD